MIEPLTLSEQQSRWTKEIDAAEAASKRWKQRARRIVKRYAQQGETEGAEREFALLWANTETIEPAIYARAPMANVSRRYRDSDPVGRAASTMLERATNYTVDDSALHDHLKNVRKDLVLVSRGTLWFRYEPSFETVSNTEETGDDPDYGRTDIEEDEPAEPVEQLVDEKVCGDFVNWDDFLHGPGRTWEEIPWVARKVYMTREQLKKRFGQTPEGLELVLKVGLDHTADDGRRRAKKAETEAKATVYELWCKADAKVYMVAKSSPDLLETREPLLRLRGFYPCPRPAFGTLSTDSLEPTPDYIYWQKQDQQVDKLTRRINKLLEGLKLVGFYPAGPKNEGQAAIERALDPSVENKLIPIPGWAAFAEKGGSKQIEYLPIDMVLATLKGCVETRRMIIEDIYQLTGISDILRGSTDAAETATAQSIKAQWGSVRIRQKQEEMARFGRDCCQIIAEIIAEQFQPETLLQMTNMQLPTAADVAMQHQHALLQHSQLAQQATMAGQQPPPPPAPPQVVTIDAVVELLRSDRLRSFKIDIETDSTIQPDEDAEKQRRTEFLTAAGGFLTTVMPVVQQAPQLAELAGQMLLFGIRGFRVARELEEAAEKAVEAMTQMASQPPAPPQPSPDEMIKAETAKMKGQAEVEKSRNEVESSRIDLAGKQLSTQAAALSAMMLPAQSPQA